MSEELLRGRNTPGYSDEEMFDALRRADARISGVLTVFDYNLLREDSDPHAQTIVNRFGWNAAKRQAGLKVSRPFGGPSGRLSDDALVQSAVTVAQALGKPPTIDEYDAYRDSHPDERLISSMLIRRRIGWTEVKRKISRSLSS